MNSHHLYHIAPRVPCHEEVLIRPDVWVPMRDGVRLCTDLYLPASSGKAICEGVPALLMRAPYDKGPSNRTDAMRWARHGYLVAVQDVRGRYASEGEFNPFFQEAEDGYDTVEWLAAQQPCDGRVGTLGASYLAWAQAAMATAAPPHLSAMCHYFGYPHNYHSVRQGGALDIFYMSYFVYMAGDGKEAQADPNVKTALLNMRFDEWLDRWPLREGQSPLALAPSYERVLFDFLRHECLDEYWKHPSLSPAEHLDKWPDVPTLWVCGWFDHYAYAHPDTLLFSRLTEVGHKHHYVVFGPWTHGETGLQIGQTTFGEDSTLQAILPDCELRWFDRWLKGIDDEGVFSARVKYFVMGGGDGSSTADGILNHGGQWKTTDFWPRRDTRACDWYLHAGGKLERTPTDVLRESTTYRADPSNPAPSSTGVSYTVTRTGTGASKRMSTNGAWDQVEGPHLHGCHPPYLPLGSRPDVLVFQSEPLDSDLEVTGHPIVELWISTDAPDTDFVAKLIDVYPPSKDYPSGIALGISEGIQRAKFRNGFDHADLLNPGEVVLVQVQMRPLSNLLQKGHRLRVDITSSSWPNFDVNTHTGRNPSADHEKRVAHNTIFHDSERPSRICLPFIQH